MATELHLLGTPCIVPSAGHTAAVRGHKAWALLAYLAMRPMGASRSHLAGLLFDDADDPLAALRWNLSELGRALGDATLRGDPISLPRDALALVDLDVLAKGRWQEGLALPGLGGELLEGQHFDSCPSFQVWLDGERRHVASLTTAMLREAAMAELAEGRAVDAAALARRLVASLCPCSGLIPVGKGLRARCLVWVGSDFAPSRGTYARERDAGAGATKRDAGADREGTTAQRRSGS